MQNFTITSKNPVHKTLFTLGKFKISALDIFSILFGLFIIAWIIAQFITDSGSNEMAVIFKNGYHAFYFTNQSNVILALSFISIALIKNKNTGNFLFAATSWITVTFLIYWILLAPSRWASSGAAAVFTGDSILLHGVSPIVGFVILFFYRQDIEVTRTTRYVISAYLVLYYVMMIIIFFATLNNEALVALRATQVAELNANGPYADADALKAAIKQYVTTEPYVLIYGFADPFAPLYINLGDKDTTLADVTANFTLVQDTAGKIIGRIVMAFVIIALLFAIPFGISYFYFKCYGVKFENIFYSVKKNKFRMFYFARKDKVVSRELKPWIKFRA